MNILSKFLSKIQNWIYLWVWFVITVWLVWIAYAAITQVASWDILTAAKFNSLIDASYHTFTSQKISTDFTITTATWNSDSNWNISLSVKNNDMIMVSLEWLFWWSATNVWPSARINLISWPWVFLSANNITPYSQWFAWWSPLSTSSILRATADWTINIWYQWYCWSPWTCRFRNIEVKAFTIWKYQ